MYAVGIGGQGNVHVIVHDEGYACRATKTRGLLCDFQQRPRRKVGIPELDHVYPAGEGRPDQVEMAETLLYLRIGDEIETGNVQFHGITLWIA